MMPKSHSISMTSAWKPVISSLLRSPGDSTGDNRIREPQAGGEHFVGKHAKAEGTREESIVINKVLPQEQEGELRQHMAPCAIPESDAKGVRNTKATRQRNCSLWTVLSRTVSHFIRYCLIKPEGRKNLIGQRNPGSLLS